MLCRGNITLVPCKHADRLCPVFILPLPQRYPSPHFPGYRDKALVTKNKAAARSVCLEKPVVNAALLLAPSEKRRLLAAGQTSVNIEHSSKGKPSPVIHCSDDVSVFWLPVRNLLSNVGGCSLLLVGNSPRYPASGAVSWFNPGW